jgi:acetyltransferase-like isoleucine patch superfamily enzyme
MKKQLFVNMPVSSNRFFFLLRYLFNKIRTFYLLNIRFFWVKYNGFVRIMQGVEFVRFDITIGHNVQFGKGSLIASDVEFKNYILVAANVSFVGKRDHDYTHVGKTMWESPRGERFVTQVENDVWIGNNATILAGVKIGAGSIIGANSVLTRDVPECEIWAGNPARKIKDRFERVEDKLNHLNYLNNL